MSGGALEGRSLLVVERDDARAGRLIVALRALGAQAVRWSDDDRGRSQARSLRPDVVLVDAASVDDWAKPALAAIASEPVLAAGTVVRTEAARLWAGEEPASGVLEALIQEVAPRAERDTKPLRAVAPPAEVTPPKAEPPKAEPAKREVTPSIGARRVASARSTEKYGAVASPSDVAPPPAVVSEAPPAAAPAAVAPRASARGVFAPPAIAPAVLAEPAKAPGYVFPTRRGAAVEEESSSKATSLDLTAVPSSILERANLPDTDRFARATPSRPWLPWAIGMAAVLAVLALLAAFVGR